MSANLVVDLFNNVHSQPSLPSTAVAGKGGIAVTSGGCVSSLSGVLIGDIIDLGDANTVCNVYVAGKPIGSGPLIIGVQCSDSTASGTFTDPTSGLAQLPGKFASGGFLILGSGAWTDGFVGIFGSGVSGNIFLSGVMTGSYFQRPQQFARLFLASGFADVAGFQAGFITQLRTVGSGGGYSYQPTSGAVNV